MILDECMETASESGCVFSPSAHPNLAVEKSWLTLTHTEHKSAKLRSRQPIIYGRGFGSNPSDRSQIVVVLRKAMVAHSLPNFTGS